MDAEPMGFIDYLRLMRCGKSAQVKVGISLTPAVCIPYDKNRIALIVPAHSQTDILIGYRGTMDIGAVNEPVVTSNGEWLMLDVWRHGEMVKGPFTLESNGLTTTVTYWETTLPDDYD